MMSEHLSQTQLEGYRGRTLYPDELLAVDRHLATCDACHERLNWILPEAGKLAMGQSLEAGEEAFHLDYEQHLEPYVDGKANDIDREIVESHVAFCSNCATELSDLLAFKQQPVAAVTAASRNAPRWKQWLPQRPLLSNPAFAVAAVLVVAVVAMAALWATYPTFRQVEMAETVSPKPDKQPQVFETAQPSPATTEESAQKNAASSQANGANVAVLPREEPLIVLNDAGGQVSLDPRGRLDGLQELPPDLKNSVEQALATRRLRASPALTGWPNGAGSLRSGLEKQGTFAPLEPADVVVETGRPTFRWRELEGARHYVVTIYDAQLRRVESSDPVTGTEWTTSNTLERGVTYSWQISALKDGTTVVSPKPPLPEARFRILAQDAVVALAKLKESAGNSHLAMGVFYWKHGLLKESEREFQALAKANPNSTAVTELLASIRSIRRH